MQPSFFIPALESPVFHIARPSTLLLFFPLGALMGLLSVALIHSIYDMESVFDRIPGSYFTRHALGMLCVGLMMYLMLRFSGHYYIQGVGYATIMDVLVGTLTDPWLLFLLLVLKLTATGLSLGSGASGGVFSPALFVGATGGAAFGHLCAAAFPTLQLDVPTFAIAGMAASIGGSTGALLTGIVMISEMTQDSRVALPLIIASSVAYAVRKSLMNESIYTMKLIARGHPVPEGLHAPFFASRSVRHVMTRTFSIVGKGDPLPAEARFVFVVDGDRIAEVIEMFPDRAPADPTRSESEVEYEPQSFVTVAAEDDLTTVLEIMVTAGADVALVSKEPGAIAPSEIVGLVTRAAMAVAIHQEKELH